MHIDLKEIWKSKKKQHILKGINLTIFPQETVAILGPSGGGKSTLLRLIAGLDPPTKGVISFDGAPLVQEETSLCEHRKLIGTVFQSWNLFPHLTAEENICLPLEKVHGLSHAEALEITHNLLTRFSLENHSHKPPAQLSGGQCQRLAILRAVAIKPRLLLFDEPTSALDPIMTAEVLDLIVEIKGEGRHFILISHHLSFIKKVADRVIFLAEGKIIENAPAKEFFSSPKSPQVIEYLTRGQKY